MAKYILVGNAREVATATSMLLAMEQMFQAYKSAGGNGGSRDTDFKPKRSGKIKVRLNFVEPLSDVDADFYPVPGEISFRLMNDDPKTISLSRIQAIATKIKEKFNNFTWRKGKAMCSYTYWEQGYQLQVLAIDGNEGRRIVDQVLEIQGHSFEAESFNVNTSWSPTTRYPVLPDKALIAGELIREDRQRPIANVKFISAEIFFPRIRRGIPILDESMQIIRKIELSGKAS